MHFGASIGFRQGTTTGLGILIPRLVNGVSGITYPWGITTLGDVLWK